MSISYIESEKQMKKVIYTNKINMKTLDSLLKLGYIVIITK